MTKYGRSRKEIAMDIMRARDQMENNKPDPTAAEIFNKPAYQPIDVTGYIKQQRDKQTKDKLPGHVNALFEGMQIMLSSVGLELEHIKVRDKESGRTYQGNWIE